MTTSEGAVHKQEKSVKFRILKARAVTFIDPIRSHTSRRLLSLWLHPKVLISTASEGNGEVDLPASARLLPLRLTVSHCSHQPWFPPRWRLSLCGGGQNRVSGSLPWLSLGPNRGGGVFMAQSGLCSQSGAAPDSPSLSLSLSHSLSSLYYNHPSYMCNYSGLSLFQGPRRFSPFHLAQYYVSP